MNSVFYFDDFELDGGSFSLQHAGQSVPVDTIVLRVLVTLVRYPGQLVSKKQLAAEVWNDRVISDNALTVAVSRLRRLLHEHGMPREGVRTVHGHGYRFTRRVTVVQRNAQPVPLADVTNPEFVGRRGILLQLKAALADAQSGNGRMVVLRGDRGIGKTQVAEILAEYAARTGCVVAWGHCPGLAETPPLWPIIRLLRALSDQIDADLREEVAPLIASALDLAANMQRVNLSPVPQQVDTKHQAFDAIARAFAVATRSTTSVMLLDDLHCADEASLALLEYLMPGLPRTRVLLVATLRSAPGADQAASDTPAALNHRNCIRIGLEPLTQIEVASYLAARFGSADPGLSQEIYDLSGGNPFCMVELVRQLQGGSKLAAAGLAVPSVVRELARQRLELLSDDARHVLSCASTIGRAFGLPLLAALVERSATALMTTLDSAIAAGVVHALAGSRTELKFTHSLSRTVLYDEQCPEQRRLLHGRLARVLEQRRAVSDVSDATLAYHYRAALPSGDPRKTVDYCVRAANAAVQTRAFADASRYLQNARETLELVEHPDPNERFELLLRQAMLVRGHSAHKFGELAEQLQTLARELGGAAIAAVSLLADPYPGLPRLAIMRGALAEAVEALPEGTPSLRPALLARVASSTPVADSGPAAYMQIEQALTLAKRSPEHADYFSAQLDELYLYGGPEHKSRAARALTGLQRLWDEQDHVGLLQGSMLDLHRTLTALQHGELALAMRALDRWEDGARSFDGELFWHAQRLRAFIEINTGNVTSGRRKLLAHHHHAQCCTGESIGSLFCVFDQQLQRSSPEPCSHAVLSPDATDPPNVWALKLRTLEIGGALDEARSALELVPPTRLRVLPCDREFLGTMGALARAAFHLRAREYAAVIYERLSPFPTCFAVNLSGYCEGSVSELLGLLARLLGEPQRAQQHFREAEVYSEQAGFSRCAADARRERLALNLLDVESLHRQGAQQ